MTTAWQAAGLSRSWWMKHSLDIRIRLSAQPYLDGSWNYSLRAPRVLWDLPAAMQASRLVGRSVTNCSTLTTSIITSVYPDVPWSLTEYAELQVFDDQLPATDTPVKAVERMGIGRIVSVFQQGEWHLVQGVRRMPSHARGFSGHAFLVNALEGGGLEVIEATSRSNIGPRYRRTTSQKLHDEYPAALHIAVLNGP